MMIERPISINFDCQVNRLWGLDLRPDWLSNTSKHSFLFTEAFHPPKIISVDETINFAEVCDSLDLSVWELWLIIGP